MMPTLPQADPTIDENSFVDPAIDKDRPWIVIVWNDPINLMTYVTHVLQSIFGFPREKAEHLMMQIHESGKAIVAESGKDKAELYVSRLHAQGLWATMQKDDDG